MEAENPIDIQLQSVMRSNPGLAIDLVKKPINEAEQPRNQFQGMGQPIRQPMDKMDQIYSAIGRIESELATRKRNNLLVYLNFFIRISPQYRGCFMDDKPVYPAILDPYLRQFTIQDQVRKF